MRLENKVVVVTGGANGMGLELVKQLLSKGNKVAAVDIDGERLNALKESANTDSLKVYKVNLANLDEVNSLKDSVLKDFGVVDAIINNAGIIQPFVKVNDLDLSVVERVMNVNFYGTLYMVKAFLPELLLRDEAHIANISSMGGFLPVPGQSVYGASKAAVKLLTEGLYSELKDTNVGVSVIFPGAIGTDITKNSGVEIKASTDQVEASKHKTLSPVKAAVQMIKAIEKNKLYAYVGKDSRTTNRLYRLAPRWTTNMIAKNMKSLLE